MQQNQAGEPIHIYYELIRSESSNKEGKLTKQSQKPEGGVYLVKDNWQAAFRQLFDEIKVRHYSPKTLKSYSTWVRGIQYFSKSKDRSYYQLRM